MVSSNNRNGSNATSNESRVNNFEPPKAISLPKPGQVIPVGLDNYYIGEFLGRGAFGKVYECFDDWGNKLVAKILSPRGPHGNHKIL